MSGQPNTATADTPQETRPLWLCPNCGGPMVVSRAERVPAQPVARAAAGFRYCFGLPEFLSHALLMGIQNADRNTFAAEDRPSVVLRSSSGRQREWSMLQSFPTWGP